MPRIQIARITPNMELCTQDTLIGCDSCEADYLEGEMLLRIAGVDETIYICTSCLEKIGAAVISHCVKNEEDSKNG